MMNTDQINDIKMKLPLPSECKSKYLDVPIIDSSSFFPVRRVTFEKDYYKGICIGWKLKDNA